MLLMVKTGTCLTLGKYRTVKGRFTKTSSCLANITGLLTHYLSYQLGFIVILQGEDGEVKLLIGQSVSKRVPHSHLTVGKGGIVVL